MIKNYNLLKKRLAAIIGEPLMNFDNFFDLYSSTGFIKGNQNGKYFESLKKLIEQENLNPVIKKETLSRLLRYSFVINDPLTLYENLLAGNNNFFIGSLEVDILRADNSLTNKPIIFLPIVLEGLSAFSNDNVQSIMHLFDVRNVIYKNDSKSILYRKLPLTGLLKKQTDFKINLRNLLESVFKNVSLINIHERFVYDNGYKNIYEYFSQKLKERVASNNFWRSLPQTILDQTNTSLTDAGKIVFSEIKELNIYKAYRDMNLYSVSNITKNFLGYILPEFIISTLSPYTDGVPLLYGRFRYRELQQSFLRSVLMCDNYHLLKTNINIEKLTPICYPVRPEADKIQDRTLVNTTFFNFQGNSDADLRIGDSEKRIIFNLKRLSPNDIYGLIRKIFVPYWTAKRELPSCISETNIIGVYDKLKNIHKHSTINDHEIFLNFVESLLLVNNKYSHLLS